jgi:Lrp/AsnC family leucine-responsive transcriptional regulator
MPRPRASSNCPPSAILARIEKPEQSGLVTGYTMRLLPQKLGRTAFVFVRAEERGTAKVGARLAALEGVQEVHQVAGEDCYLVKLRVRDTDDLARLLGAVKSIQGIQGTRTTIVLGTLKETAQISLSRLTDADEGDA